MLGGAAHAGYDDECASGAVKMAILVVLVMMAVLDVLATTGSSYLVKPTIMTPLQ